MAGRTAPAPALNPLMKSRRRRVSTAIIAITALTLLIQIAGFVYGAGQQAALARVIAERGELREARMALVDAELAVEGYAHAGDDRRLRDYFVAREAIDRRRVILVGMDAARRGGVATRIDQLSGAWTEAVETTRRGGGEEAQKMLAEGRTWSQVESLRDDLDTAIEAKTADETRHEILLRNGYFLVLALQLAGGSLVLAGLFYAFRASAAEARARRAATDQAVSARRQVEHLFEMTDILQSAGSLADANAVLQATAEKLLPGLDGALYVFNNSRDRLDLSLAWGDTREAAPEFIAPTQCWALKRGKPHHNLAGGAGLRCEHNQGLDEVVLELPMMARGEVYGLLLIRTDGEDARERLDRAAPLATALADSMSLALSNLALREKLRNQALRDPLTGLYNRRYMEDMLERFTLLAQRSGSAAAVMMIDLDHFKRLNDEHGHAMGDAILRETAGVVAGGLRQSDVACRYGGEELVVLLPDCTLDSAVAKAEVIRSRIEALSDLHNVRVTASFGVAAMPETSAQAADLLPLADAALYRAKQSGRNKVVAAPRREGPPDGVRHAAE
ncbi:MAG: diguanylate cyclase [Caulobacter sp.]|nr:diguanylate cyclase [Caulobacter sp.]